MTQATQSVLARIIVKLPDTDGIDAFAMVTATNPHSARPSKLTFEFGVPHSQFPTTLPDSYFAGMQDFVTLLAVENILTTTDHQEVMKTGAITSSIDNFAQFTLLAQLHDPISKFTRSMMEMITLPDFDQDFAQFMALIETGDPQFSLCSAFDVFVTLDKADKDFTAALKRHNERYDWSGLDPQIVRIHDQIEKQCGTPHDRIYSVEK